MCCRCGNKNHKSYNISFPAINANCMKCDFKGHLKPQKHCRNTAEQGPRKEKVLASHQNTDTKTKKPKCETPKNSDTTAVDYIFHIDDDATINCQVVGVNILMLIDSSNKSNIINDKTWEHNEAILSYSFQSTKVFRQNVYGIWNKTSSKSDRLI